MKPASGFVAYFSSFDFGGDALLILVDREAIDWLMLQFDHVSRNPNGSGCLPFVIGDGHPIESDGKCLIRVQLGALAEGSHLVRKSESSFDWMISSTAAKHYRDLLSGMLDPRPGHQYLDPDNSPPAPVVIIARDEYDRDWVRQVKLRNEAK